MKLGLVLLTLAFSARLGLGQGVCQGVVDFQNSRETAVTNGLTGEPVPVGTAFRVALYYGPDEVTDPELFIPLGQPTGFSPVPGRFAGGNRTTPGTSGGGIANLQVRIWETAYGATYEDAINAPPLLGRPALRAESNLMRGRVGSTCFPPTPPAPGLPYLGLQPMVLVVPEPSQWALSLVGGVLTALALRRHWSARVCSTTGRAFFSR